jgi:hypothetical protein
VPTPPRAQYQRQDMRRLLHQSNTLSVPAPEPKILFGTNFKVALVFVQPGRDWRLFDMFYFQ